MSTTLTFSVIDPAIESAPARTLEDASLPGRDIQIDYTTKRWVLENRDFVLTRGKTAIKQRIDLRVMLFLGEYAPDTSEGTPWREDILVKGARPAIVQAILRDRIRGVPGVVSVNDVSLDFDSTTRVATFAYSVATDIGQIVSSTEVTI